MGSWVRRIWGPCLEGPALPPTLPALRSLLHAVRLAWDQLLAAGGGAVAEAVAFALRRTYLVPLRLLVGRDSGSEEAASQEGLDPTMAGCVPNPTDGLFLGFAEVRCPIRSVASQELCVSFKNKYFHKVFCCAVFFCFLGWVNVPQNMPVEVGPVKRFGENHFVVVPQGVPAHAHPAA